jgi:hypothetical protein
VFRKKGVSITCFEQALGIEGSVDRVLIPSGIGADLKDDGFGHACDSLLTNFGIGNMVSVTDVLGKGFSPAPQTEGKDGLWQCRICSRFRVAAPW